MAYTFDSTIISDLHKDARGYRPDAYFRQEWNDASADAKQEIWDRLCAELEHVLAEEKKACNAAVEQFEKLIADNIALGAGTRENAIIWLVDGLGLSEIDLKYGGGYICYKLGLPYTMENEINDALDWKVSLLY